MKALWLTFLIFFSAEAFAYSFFTAVKDNDLERAELMLKEGADPNKKESLTRDEMLSFIDDFYRSPFISMHYVSVLSMAVLNNSPQMAKLLFKHKADPNETEALRFAILIDSPEMLELLLKHKADPNKNDSLATAIKHKRSGKILKLLIQYGADPNDDGGLFSNKKPALHHAVKSGNLSAVKILVENNADIHQENYLKMAYYYEREDIVNYLKNELGLRLGN